MLTEEEKTDIQKEMKLYPYPQAACLDALKIVQSERKWITDEAVKDIAEFLEMSPDEVDGVATFYSRIYRQPVGRNIILLCNSMSCMVMGYESVYDQLFKKLGIRFGETTHDNRFTLLPISCLGACDHAPAMMINDDLIEDVTEEKLDQIFKNYL